METIKKGGFLKAAYDQSRRHRAEPYHLGPAFDIAVCLLFLITLVSYFTT
jgi:hypothetical protein